MTGERGGLGDACPGGDGTSGLNEPGDCARQTGVRMSSEGAFGMSSEGVFGLGEEVSGIGL
jgi:hypothetical protein